MGLRIKFILVLLIICLTGTTAIGFVSYKLSEKAAIDEAKDKGQLIFNYIVATRKFFKNYQFPLVHELVGRDRFIPEIMSGFSVTRGIWDKFGKEQKDYIFKQATLDPLYPPNKADPQEIAIINKFDRNKHLKTLEGVMQKGNERFFYLAYPIMVDAKGCLRCHGDPANAPQDQIRLYGTDNGYNWKLDKVVSSFVIYVSVDHALEHAKRDALIIFGAVGGAMLFALILLGGILDRTIVKRIESLSSHAVALSFGEGLNNQLEYHERDEIGSMTHGIERLRNSLARLMRMNI